MTAVGMTDPIRVLEQRLEHGWALIDEAVDARDNTEAQRLTDHWLRVEAEYRAACDARSARLSAESGKGDNTTLNMVRPVSRDTGQRRNAQTQMELRA